MTPVDLVPQVIVLKRRELVPQMLSNWDSIFRFTLEKKLTWILLLDSLKITTAVISMSTSGQTTSYEVSWQLIALENLANLPPGPF